VRVLFDHCVPAPFRRALVGHDVITAGEMGWEQLENGLLLREASDSFDAVVTVDKKLKHEQNLSQLPIAVVLILAPSNTLEHLLPSTPLVLDALKNLKPRQFIEIHPPPLSDE
jgi:hypothetical protein